MSSTLSYISWKSAEQIKFDLISNKQHYCLFLFELQIIYIFFYIFRYSLNTHHSRSFKMEKYFHFLIFFILKWVSWT